MNSVEKEENLDSMLVESAMHENGAGKHNRMM